MYQVDYPLAPPANPGGSSAATVYDTGTVSLSDLRRANGGKRKRCRVIVFTDVADMKLRVEWAAPGSLTLRLFQADVAISASTTFQRNIRLQPGRTKISLVTTTNPTTFEVGADLCDDQALDQ